MPLGMSVCMQQKNLQPETGSLLDLCLKEMSRRNAVHAQRYLPYYLSSTMNHILNLRNQRDPFFYDESGPYNFRTHLLYLSPTGGGKTYWVKNLGRQVNALFRGVLQIAYKGSMTAAAFTGTIRRGANGIIPIDGIAKKCAEHVIMIEEFHSTLKSMDNPYGDDLENHFLTALDSGWVFRDLAEGAIEFQTQCTLQAASQFTRVKTSSGMLRRFVVVSFKPTAEDLVRLKMSRRARRRLIFDNKPTLQIRKYFLELQEDVNNLKGLALETEKLDEMFDRLGKSHFLPHYDEDIYERFIIGLNLVMKESIGDYPVVTVNPEIENYVRMAIEWRHEALMGAELALALNTIRDYITNNKVNAMETSKYRLSMINFGLSFEESQAILRKLSNYNVVGVAAGKIRLKEF